MKLPFPHKLSPRDAIRAAIPVLAFALIASVVTGREKPAEAPPQPARIDARVSAKAAVEQDLDLSGLTRDGADAKLAPASDPFARRSFAPPAPAASPAPGETVASASAPAPRPSAPPLPFTYVGKMIEDGTLKVFVARGEKSYTLSAGLSIDQYRVDKVSDSQVTFTYLPMKARQTLDIAPASP